MWGEKVYINTPYPSTTIKVSYRCAIKQTTLLSLLYPQSVKKKKNIKEREKDKSRHQAPHQTLTHGVTNTPGVYVFHPRSVKLNH